MSEVIDTAADVDGPLERALLRSAFAAIAGGVAKVLFAPLGEVSAACVGY
jgi:hypothetical protein